MDDLSIKFKSRMIGIRNNVKRAMRELTKATQRKIKVDKDGAGVHAGV